MTFTGYHDLSLVKAVVYGMHQSRVEHLPVFTDTKVNNNCYCFNIL